MNRLLLLCCAGAWAAGTDLSPRFATAAGSLDEMFLSGAVTPSVATSDQDAMHETWSRFAGLPTSLELGDAQGPLLGEPQGNAWAGAALADSIELFPEVGFGGMPWLRLRSATVLPDTPRTRIAFWRGPVGSYRFGLDVERRLSRSVGLRVATQMRSYPARAWKYRDQVNTWYVSSARPVDSLPNRGVTPGLDDSRWEAALGTPLPGGSIEVGWRWNDVDRGFPDPSADTLSLPLRGERNSQLGFVQLRTQGSFWQVDAGGSIGSLDFTQPQWALDTTGARMASFSGTESRAQGEFLLRGPAWQIGPQFLFLRHDGTANLSIAYVEQIQRTGLGATLGTDQGPYLMASAGRTTADLPQGFFDFWDATGRLGWNGTGLAAELEASRQARFPLLTESVLGDPDTRWQPSTALVPQENLYSQATLRLSPLGFLQLDGSAAVLSISNRIAPAAFGQEQGSLVTVGSAVAMSILSGQSQGYGLRGGARLHLGGWQLRSEISRAWLYAPDGSVDLSLPQIHIRSILDWQGKVLRGNMTLNSRLTLNSTTRSWAWVPAGVASGASDVATAKRIELRAANLLDWENRFEIGRFGLYWNLQNLTNQNVEPTPGWQALGVRSGFGIQWALPG